MIDHILLKPDSTLGQISRLCREARDNHFAAVCTNPFYISQVHTLLKGSGIKTCSVIGFPIGAGSIPGKAFEAHSVIAAGAQEVDMVINIGALKDHTDLIVAHDISSVVGVCHAPGGILKVVLETGLLTQEEKERACRLCIEADADFVKTSTGFGFGGGRRRMISA